MQEFKLATITLHNTHTGSYGYTGMDFVFDNMDCVETNTLRRTILEHVPMFGFHPRQIKISNNTSVFNNDYIKLRISNIPIQTDLNDRSTMQWYQYDKSIMVKNNSTRYEETQDNDDNDDNDDDDLNVINDPTDKPPIDANTDDYVVTKYNYNSVINNISMYFEKENNSNKILNVTTDDCTYWFKGQQIDNFYKFPMLLVQLQPSQKIRCLAESMIGTGKMNELWSPVSICCYKEVTESKYIFSIESIGQLTEPEIVFRSATIVCKLLDDLEKYLEQADAITETELNAGTIVVKDKTIGNHTIGNIFNHYLQSHDNITFSGYKMPHLLENIFEIRYATDGSISIVKIIHDVIHKLKQKFTDIARQVDQLQ